MLRSCIGGALLAMLGASPARAEGDAAAPAGADGGTDALPPVPDAASSPPIADGGTDLPSRVPDATPAPVPGVAPIPVPDAAPAPAGETTVRTRRRESGQTTLSPADIRNMPGAFGDPFRAIEA